MQIIKVIGRTKRISKKEKTASGEFWLNIIGQNMYSERSFPKRCCCIALASAWTDVSAVPPWLLHILLLQSPYLFLSFTLSLNEFPHMYEHVPSSSSTSRHRRWHPWRRHLPYHHGRHLPMPYVRHPQRSAVPSSSLRWT